MSKNVRKGSEAKHYPNTIDSIQQALESARRKNDTLGGATFLSPATNARLTAMEPLFSQTAQQTASKLAERAGLIAQKEQARVSTFLHASHFMQVFNLGVKRGKYLSSERGFFSLPVETKKLPRLQTDAHIRTVAELVAVGEAARIAAGNQAVTNPSGAEVEAAVSLFKTLTALAGKADGELADNQKALRALMKEARDVIKDVWYEVEFHYRKGTSEHKRKMAREWGVHYARKGGEKKVSGTCTDAATGLPLGAVKVKFENGRNKTFTDQHGRFSLITNLLHSQALTATRSGYTSAKIIVELKEGEEHVCAVKMVKEE